MSEYKKMSCKNRMTGQFVGYLGTHDNYVAIGPKVEDASLLKWIPDDGDVYLAKETTPNDRYLGGASADDAGWYLWIGKGIAPVIRNGDGTISLKSDRNSKLYGPISGVGGIDYVAWSKSDDNQNILVCDMVD